MGGGGAMRTAAKVAGIGVAPAGMRGVPVAPPVEQSFRQASRPVSAVLSSQGAKAAEVAPQHTAASWDSDDWELTYGDELIMEAGEPMPRVVFGGVPSFQEAKAATSELKDAIDKIYLSSNSSECEGSSTGSEVSVLSPHPESEIKSHVIEAISTPSVPNSALQAFKFLSTRPEVQNVVASVTSDLNVWNAVMENPALKDFIQSQQAAKLAAVAGFEAEDSPEKFEELPNSDPTGSQGKGVDFIGILENIKLTVAEMVSSASSYLHSIFGLSAAEKTSSDANGNTKANFMDSLPLGGTFMGLVVLVALVVLVKRV